MKEKVQDWGVQYNKNIQMYEARVILAGLFVQPLLVAGLAAYALDRFTNRFTNKYFFGDKDGSRSMRLYGKRDTIAQDFINAVTPQALVRRHAA